MKIKTVKKLNLHELIMHVWEKDDYPNRFVNNFNGEVVFNGSGKFMTDDSFISHNSLFPVEVEEDLKMSTKLPFMVHMYIDADGKERSENCYNQSIVECQFPVECKEISLTMYSASGGDLTFIWSGRNGIPEDGILELME